MNTVCLLSALLNPTIGLGDVEAPRQHLSSGTFSRGVFRISVKVGITAMGKRVLLGSVVLISGILVAQQPVPMGKVDASARNYHAADGTLLSNHSTDEQLARALNESYGNDPEFGSVQVIVKHHKVTLLGNVQTKDAKRRAQGVAEHTAGVRSVRNHLKLGDVDMQKRAVIMTSSQ